MASRSFFLLFFLLSVPAFLARANLIDDTCGEPDDESGPDYCRDCLRKDPHSGSANLQGLATIMLDCSITTAGEARDKAVDLSSNRGGILGACAEDFAQAHIALSRTRTFVHNRNFAGAQAASNTCSDRYWACLHRFGTDSKVPKPLLPLMKRLKGQCDIASDIVSDL